MQSSPRIALALVLLSTAACSKKKDDAPSPPPTAAVREPAPAAVASTVSLTIDPDVSSDKDYGFSSKKLDLTGPALVFVDGSEDAWRYNIVFSPAGANVDCKTKLDVKKPLDKKFALVVFDDHDHPAPKAGVEIAGAYEMHYESAGKHANSSLFDGARVKITGVSASTITGELSGHSDDGAMTGAGTFTAQLCTNVE
ncbi:MAG TPA: hypothetical protein VGM39_24445 [Kofleriaceae bacterium]|jgi:hypothetical protein